MSKKVICIGLDGATFDYILPYLDELPTFKHLLDKGSWGPLKSVIHPHTAPAWPSYMTGKNPSKHSIYSFFYKTQDHNIEFVNSKNIMSNTLMDILKYNNKKVISVNIPVTYPVWDVNGIMISGMLTQSKEKCCMPKNILDELKDYKIECDANFHENNIDAFLDNVYDTMEKRKKAALYLMDKYEWDFFTIVFRASDTISHTMYQFLDKSNPMHDKYGKEILNLYKKMDSLLKEFIDRIDDDTSLLIMSDHGHGKLIKNINLNMWLLKEGYLQFKKDFFHSIKYFMFKCGFSLVGVYKILAKLKLHNLVAKIPREKRYKLSNLLLSYKDVDWKKTKAYTLGPFGQIYINLKGRDKDGIVEQGKEYDELIEKLKEKLLNFKDPDNNNLIFEKILRKDEVYDGPYLDKAPDLYLIPTKFEYSCSEILTAQSEIFAPTPKGWTGTHKMNGVFLAYGNNVKKSNKIDNAEIIDLTPTILNMFNIQIPDDLDGKVLSNVFQNPNKVEKIASDKLSIERDYEGKTVENKKEVEKRLKSLGYM